MRGSIPLLTLAAAWVYVAADHGHTPYDELFNSAGAEYGVPPNLLRAVARSESGFNPAAIGAAGERGMMQLTRATASSVGLDWARALEPRENVRAAARYFVTLRRNLGARWSAWTWVAAYNAGPDLEPAAKANAYALRVVYHWLGYDAGRVFA